NIVSVTTGSITANFTFPGNSVLQNNPSGTRYKLEASLTPPNSDGSFTSPIASPILTQAGGQDGRLTINPLTIQGLQAGQEYYIHVRAIANSRELAEDIYS